MKKFNRFKKAYGLNDYGIIDFPKKVSGIKISRIKSRRRIWLFPDVSLMDMKLSIALFLSAIGKAIEKNNVEKEFDLIKTLKLFVFKTTSSPNLSFKGEEQKSLPLKGDLEGCFTLHIFLVF